MYFLSIGSVQAYRKLSGAFSVTKTHFAGGGYIFFLTVVQSKHTEMNDIEELVIKFRTDITRTKASIKDDEALEKR